MPRRITVTFADGSQHIYENAPDDVTPQQVVDRATKEFRKPVKGLDGGRGVIERTARAVGGIASGIYYAADKAMQPLRDAVGYDAATQNSQTDEAAARKRAAIQTDIATQDGLLDAAGDFFLRGEMSAAAGIERAASGLALNAAERQRYVDRARASEQVAKTPIAGETTWENATSNLTRMPGFILEKGIESLPYMATAAAGPFGFLANAASTTGQVAQSRAEADNRQDASAGDVAIAAPFGVVSTTLDNLSLGALTKGFGGGIASGIAKGALLEGGTEAIQSGIEYTGGAVGTQRGFDVSELGSQMLQGGVVGFGVGAGFGGIHTGGEKVVRVIGDKVRARPIAPGVRATAATTVAIPTEGDIASPIPTDLIQQGKASVADAEATATADSILRAAGMPTTGTRVNVRMPDGTVRAGTMADAFMTDAGDMGTAAGLTVNLEDGTIFTEHFDTLTDAGVTVTPVDPAAAANAAFDDVVNAAAQAGGFAAPGSGLLNPPALPAPTDQAEQPKGMRGTPVKDAKAAIEAVYPGVRVTSWTRGADSVGSPTSWHKRSRAAVDVAPIKGMTFDEFIGGLKAKGYSIIEAIDEVKNPSKWATGPHWHVVLGEGGSQQAGPRATSAPIGGESVQDDMFGGPSLTEGQIAARDNVGRVLDEAVAEDDTFDLRKAARELEAARVDFEASGQGKFSDYVDPMSDIPGSLRQAIDANPNLLPLVLQRAGIEDAAANVAAPTEAQKEAGNYRKGHVRLHGLDITIETPRGAERSGTDPSGKKWSVSMPDHYGYVKRTEGADGEQVDVYVGPNPESPRVFLIDQNDADTGKFDEHKAMLGYRSSVDALDAYNAAFDDGRGDERMGNVVEMSVAEFREWLKQPQTAPAGETIPQGTTGTGAEAPAAQPSSNAEQLPAAPEEGPLSTETMPGAGPRNKLVLRTHRVDGGYRVDADYEIGGFTGGGQSATGATPEAARAAIVERLGWQLDPNTFGSAANEQHRKAATNMMKWLRRGEGPAGGTTQDTSGPQDGGARSPVEAPEAGGTEATATSSAGSAAGAATLKPYLRAWYNDARDMLEDAGEDVSDMDGPGAVKAAMTMIEDQATSPAESAKEAVETSNADNAERGQTEADDRGSAQGARSEGLPAGEGERDAGRDSGEQDRGGAADLPADDAGRGEQDREPVNPERPAAGGGKRKSGGSRNGDSAGNRVRRDKPARYDGGVNYFAPVGSLKREGGWKTTATRNLDIIELINRLTAENRQATPEEQALLAKWTGWGAGEIRNNLFRTVKRLPGGGRAIVPPAFGEWKDVGERAARLLQGDALETALQSTQYAHYTSEGVIRSIWKGLERLGFTGGKILEPGMGSGLFAIAAPKGIMDQSSYTGIEMDAFTAKVAGYLLPAENVIAADFVKQKLPNGFFDVAIGNPPFANIQVTDDPAYRRYRFSLHDYFFAKSIDKVRPGGIMVFVTSRYTMDKLDRKAREYIAERADLLGAVRLPQTAFKENAGTEVVTDVLFFQRRALGTEMGGKDWLASEPIKIGAEEIAINAYYVQHPEMVLGKHATTGSMYRKNEYTVEAPEGDIEEAFAKVISKLPQGVFLEAAPEAAQTAERKTFEADMIPAAEKEGGLYLKNGVLHVRQDGIGVALESTANLNGKEKVWLADYVPLRDAVKQAQRDQLQDGPWEKSLAALNKLYDAFVKKHGPISAFTQSERTDQVTADEGEPGAYFDKKEGEWVKDVTRVTKWFTNRRRLRFDVESTLVEALEKIADDGKISKGPFLLGRTIDKPKRGKVESASDAVAVTLDEIGRFEPDYAAQLRGVPVTDLLKELGDEVYQAPDGTWTLADEYLSGDVVAKLEEAQTAAANDPRFERNVAALIKVQPKPLAYADISVRLGAGWIEPKVIEQFAEEVLEDPVDGLHYEPATGIWTVPESRRRTGRSASSEYATEDRSARELLDAVLNNRTIKITRKDSDKKTYTDQEATALANERAKKIGDKFRSWIWTDANRAQRLAAKYNRLFNNLAPRRFDGSHLTFPGLSTRYKLYDHQRRAIWRVIATGNTYLNHAVGAGKTLEMIVSAMEQRRLGLVRKPMFVVPNHMLNQFAREFLDAYPAANLMVADEHAFQTENRRRFMAKAALNDPDAIIVPHSSLVKIGTLEATRQAVIDRFIGELEEAMNALDGDSGRHARKNIENQIERIKRQFAGKADTETKDRALTFEEMGVDFLYVDEAHEFRKLDFATNRTSVKGIDSNGSKRALDLYIKLLWLNEQRPGRAAVLASGTPVTNTMAEIYTVMRYMDQTGLERDGLAAFDAWAANFGEVVPGFEQNAAGGYEIVERFSKFVNVPELMKRVRTFMDVLTSPQLGDLVKRPDVKGGGPQNVVAKPSDELNAYMKGELATRIQVSRKFKPSKDQPNNPDPLINIITDGRLSAIDMRFVDNTAPNDPGSKLNLMIDRIIENARAYRSIEYTDPKTGQKLPRKGATQIVFSAVGFGDQVAKNRGFDARAWVDKRLIDAGLSPSEIAWMSDQNTHAKKEATFKAMRNAEITTLLGSPKNMGTGVNVQARLKALHFLSPPWYPSDVEQPHGRIIRQGNMNPEVEIYWYATKGTYDSTAWQMVSRKAKFIEQAMSGDETIRSIEDISEANQYEMASALAAGDERAIQLAGLSGDIERLTKLRAAHADEQTSLRWESKRLERSIASEMQRSANYAAAAEARGEMGPFAVRVDGISYDRPGEAGAAMIAAIGKELEAFDGGDLKSVEIGRYRDNLPINLTIEMRPLDGAMKRYFDLTVQAGPVELAIVEERRSTDSLDAVGISQRIQNALRGIDADRREIQTFMEQIRSEQAKVSRKLGAPFEYEADLAERVAERARLEGELAAETAAAQKAIDEAAKVKEDAVLYEAIAEDGGQEYNGTDDDPTDPDGPGRGSGAPAEPADMSGDGAVLRSRGPVLRGLGIAAKDDPRGNGAGASNGGRAGNGDEIRSDRVPVVRGLGIAARFERHGSTALVGQTVTSERDLAEIAQIYRDPRYETLRVFFTNGNKIVHSTAVTTRSASSAPLLSDSNSTDRFIRWLGETMRSSGADGYYLLHNHPTGVPQPSEPDIKVTRAVASGAFGFRGHVIINSNKFGTIDWSGKGAVYPLPSRPDKLLTPSKPHPILGEVLLKPADLAWLAKDVQIAQGKYFSLVLTGSNGLVRAVVDVPLSMLDRPEIIVLGALRKHLRLSGSEGVFLVGTAEDIDRPAVRKALSAGVLTAAISDSGVSINGEKERLPDFLLGGKNNALAAERTAFENEETERRFQEAKAGLATTQTLRERVSEAWERAWNGITRHWIALPNEARYAALQEKLRAIEAAPQSARERTIRLLDDMVKDFTDADLDLFTRKVILDDLSWDAANDRDLPFGFTPETLRAEKAKIDQLVKDQPEQRVHKAVMKRKLVNRKIAQELVDAGVLEAEQIKNPAYYRHQVLEYARAQAQYARTPGKKLRTPKWAKRMGSTLDINANLLEAEFDWLNKALLDIPVARTIEWIGKSEHNILDRLKKQAKDSNDEGVRRELAKAREVLDENESGPEVEAAMLLIEQEKGFRQYIAMGFEHVRTALENDEIKVPARFAKAAAAIESGKGSTSEPPFAFLSWLLDSDQPGAMGAAMIMKAISQRRVWTKKLLGREYIDPQDANALVKSLAPEGYRTWQPDEGKLLFTVKTLPEHVIDGMIEKLESADGIDPSAFRGALEGARNALAMGGDRYTMILPEEVADTLSNLRREELDSLFDHFIKEPVKLWKRWVLINPRRFFKYNLNNTSGDLDAVIAGNPRSLRRIGEAGRELAQVMTGRAKASARYEEAVARGVFDSGLSVQEIPDIHKLEPFERFAKKPGPINKVTILPLRKAWAALQGATQWRENVMRYAAYLDYVERIEAGESQKSIGYGASRPDMVDAVADPKDRAALLARDLLGDYGAISHYGGSLRQTVIPFWSWLEINTKRYWRLTMNAGSQGIGKGVATGGALAIAQGARTTAWLGLRMAMLYGLLSLWNQLFFPDEEDELGEAQRAQMHVILGRNAEGEIITMRAQGALSDALSWFGLENVGKAARDYELGRGSLVDVVTAAPKATINKIATSLSPVITVPVEAATGKKLWPDVFNTRANRDPWRNLFQTVSLENEYDMAQGLPTRGYGRSWQEAVIYRRDPGEIAYNEGRGIAYDWLKREKGQSFEGGFSTPRGDAMRNYRTAIRYGDREAAAAALDEMVKLGVDAGDFRAMIKRAAPLGPIPKKDRAAFVAQLTDDERATMVRAQEWYNTTFLGR